MRTLHTLFSMFCKIKNKVLRKKREKERESRPCVYVESESHGLLPVVLLAMARL